MKTSLLALSAVGLLAAAPALAQVEAMAATDLNLRAGPGSSFEVVGVIPAEGIVSVMGCLDADSWCEVTYEGQTAWAYGEYLTAMMAAEPMVVYENRAALEVATVTYDNETSDAEAATGGAATGALAAAALAGGPAALVAGAALGAAGAAITNPDDAAVTYVRENPVEAIYLDGEVIVGAGVPEEVALIEVPDSELGYVNVNGLPVLVQRDSRQIVHVVR